MSDTRLCQYFQGRYRTNNRSDVVAAGAKYQVSIWGSRRNSPYVSPITSITSVTAHTTPSSFPPLFDPHISCSCSSTLLREQSQWSAVYVKHRLHSTIVKLMEWDSSGGWANMLNGVTNPQPSTMSKSC